MLLAGVLIAGCGGKDPAISAAAEKFVTCTFSGDTECLHSVTYLGDAGSPTEKLGTSLLVMTSSMAKLQANLSGGVEKVTSKVLSVKDNRAEVEYTVTFKAAAESKTDKLHLTKTDAGWKVLLQ